MSDGTAQLASEEVRIVNVKGLHARASAKFVNMVAMLPAELSVSVHKDGTEAAGGSILGLMMLGAAKGDTIAISVSGEGADSALAKLAGLVKDGFGED
jgi:phosphocarrier protein HPr